MKKQYLYLNPTTGKPVTRQRLWQIKQKSKGRCVKCPDPATHGVFCERHYQASVRASRRIHNSKPWQPGKRGRPPIRAME